MAKYDQFAAGVEDVRQVDAGLQVRSPSTFTLLSLAPSMPALARTS